VTEAERFDLILDELRQILLDLGDLSAHVVLVGGQVLALEDLAEGGSGIIHVETATGVVIERGFSMEPDLLFDTESDSAQMFGERLPLVLRARGFVPTRGFRWSKDVAGEPMHVDLFCTPDTEAEAPTSMTPLPSADLALARAHPITVNVLDRDLTISVPDAAGFLAMKLEAKLRLRPDLKKDSFDLFTYVKRNTVAVVAQSLARRTVPGPKIAGELRRLFADESAPGTRDLLGYAPTLGEMDRQLLVREAIDLFNKLEREVARTRAGHG
jgi:hypothetical protein